MCSKCNTLSINTNTRGINYYYNIYFFFKKSSVHLAKNRTMDCIMQDKTKKSATGSLISARKQLVLAGQRKICNAEAIRISAQPIIQRLQIQDGGMADSLFPISHSDTNQS